MSDPKNSVVCMNAPKRPEPTAYRKDRCTLVNQRLIPYNRFGKERKVASSSRITVEYLDTMEEPYHVFVFRYRPEGPYFDVHSMFVLTLVLIAMLRAQGINVVSSSAAPSANNNLAPSGENANEGGSQSNKRTLYIDGTLSCIPALAYTDSRRLL